mmetsp:Transcript_38340/g.59848  ORF Transcript_38340/g.59848 Transcript_38340/m.59848 type:complete len:140 (-) Transcript_38340:1124-1543(-)|eukprot:CAMPEP_0184300880 /NCGR_PEP_ID=MMETSP1049-20130417/11203_1 /TAXON_ID=77928 /ORGANISM="Proteomonas sulcata, Strain CCMP704" /LENGTH=139 /DNA_ID=CAMNT_0026611721 /DNA_START=343 /DNA_END=762 /DNA_ORIENTATION=-
MASEMIWYEMDCERIKLAVTVNGVMGMFNHFHLATFQIALVSLSSIPFICYSLDPEGYAHIGDCFWNTLLYVLLVIPVLLFITTAGGVSVRHCWYYRRADSDLSGPGSSSEGPGSEHSEVTGLPSIPEASWRGPKPKEG